SSSRSVSMRDIVVGFFNAPLYPGLQISGMTNGAGAFTLIELLVVVLIIGILAAVALPQYKVAVAKARMTQLVTLANAVKQAEERYYLANGQYTTDWTELDLDINGTINSTYLNNPAGWHLLLTPDVANATDAAVQAWDTRILSGTTQQNSLYLYFAFDHAQGGHRGERLCFAPTSSQLGNTVCKSVTNNAPAHPQSSGNVTWYVFQ
uniref:type IV pilin protein n=1 Tax=Candidatus Avelusimicrobium caledoniensis TaxID=3416220 RepID=UPI003D10A6CA